MGTVLAQPKGIDLGPTEPVVTRKGRRWPWLVLAFLLVTTAAAFWAGSVYFSAYSPLRTGSGFLGYDVEGVPDNKLDVRSTFAGSATEPSDIVILPFQEGGHVRFFVPLLNDGAFEVEIDAFRLPHAPYFAAILQPAGVGIASGHKGMPRPEHARPFQPFELEAGATVLVVVDYEFVCQRYVERQAVDHLTVRYSTFGFTAEQDVVLPWRLVTGWQTREDCGFPKGRFVAD